MTTFFDCSRTCPLAGERWCRFRPILDVLGPTKVDSHTARVEVEFRDPESLKAAVLAMGGTWLGQGTHRLYGGKVTGFGFKLPGWKYPLILAGRELAYDDYHGKWGNVEDLEKLKQAYTLGVTERAAQALGWLTEIAGNVLTVYHPLGGVLTLTSTGECSTSGFVGQGCHTAREMLGLAVVEGTLVETGEACQTAARVSLPQV